MNGKRGQGLSTNAIILIILGVVVLVMLVLGFSLGWNKLNPFLSTNNVKTIVTTCSIACSTSGQFDFCSEKRELNDGEGALKDVTCFYLSQKEKEYGIQSCSSITCPVVLVEVDEEVENALQSKCAGNEGKTVQALVGNELQTYDCPASSS